MTRVNLVDPQLLQTKHLVAEYRELPRIFALIRKAQERGESPHDLRNPKIYTLGTGHVRFFYNKAAWLVDRQKKLIAECIAREINIQYTETDHLLNGIDQKWCNNWLPTKEEININIARINDRGGLKESQ